MDVQVAIQIPLILFYPMGFRGGSVVKNLPANAGDVGLTPGLGRSLEKEMATHSSVLTWRIPWMEGPGGPQSIRSQRVGSDWETDSYTHTHIPPHTVFYTLWLLKLESQSIYPFSA